jgi:hypothetical protein
LKRSLVLAAVAVAVLLVAESCAGRRPRCTPNCKGLVCGDDGCGGSCGLCGEATFCAVGQCLCVPECRLRHCGDDGCGGTCGECQDGAACQGGLCVCEGSCAGRTCGDDGCYGSCGVCPAGHVCTEAGACCEPDCEDRQCGGDGCGGTCGECPAGYQCEGSLCVCDPQCHGRQCGSDGCLGSCGVCSAWEICAGSGASGAHCELTGLTCTGDGDAAAGEPCGGACAEGEVCSSLCGTQTCTCEGLAACPPGAAACLLLSEDPDTPRFCVPPCGTGSTCPDGLSCVEVWGGAATVEACGVPLHFVCRPCASDAECQAASDRCLRFAADGQKRCFSACPPPPDSCGDGLSCVPGEGASTCQPTSCPAP